MKKIVRKCDLAALALGGVVHASEFYVSPKGDDANQGTEALSYRTA